MSFFTDLVFWSCVEVSVPSSTDINLHCWVALPQLFDRGADTYGVDGRKI